MGETHTVGAATGETNEEIWLLGQPSLRDYLDFVRDAAVGGAGADFAAATAEWRRANDHYQALETREAGLADEVELRDLDPAMARLAEQVTADPRYRRTFRKLPTTFAMVELDKLVVSQKSVTRDFVDALAARLGPAPDPEALFRFCLPLERPETPVRIQRLGSRRYVFRSDSTDFRFHEAALLGPEQLRDYGAYGPVAGVIGLVVGYGSNFLNVIRAERRLILNNGYHRACALRALGLRHAPAIVQTVTRGDELEITAGSSVTRDPTLYVRGARPPLLRDFFDPAIRKPLRVHKQVRMVEVTWEVREVLVND